MSTKSVALLTSYVTTLFASGEVIAEEGNALATGGTFNLRQSNYSEQDMSASDISVGSRQRYEIDITQLNLFIPINETLSLSMNHLTESMTGATPWYTERNTQDQLLVAMTGATVYEDRQDTTIQLSHEQSNQSQRMLVGYSEENDYQAQYLEWGQSFSWNLKNQSLSYRLHVSDDEITPTQNNLVERISFAEKKARGFSVSWSQTLDTTSVFDIGMFGQKYSGYLTDPYKVFDINTPLDVRPNSRASWGIETGLSKYFPDYSLATHARYRLYDDDWGVQSHTIELTGATTLTDEMDLSISLRSYTQTSADFYSVDSRIVVSGFGSSDYRLSAFSSLSIQAELTFKLSNHWDLMVGIENYRSNQSWNESSAEERHPGLVDYALLGVEIGYRF